MNEETEQRTAGYITLPLAVLDGWVGQNAQYLKWWTQLRREASWTDKTVWHNRFMIVLDGSTATGKTTLMTAMRQTLRWLTDHRLVSDDVGLRILDATKICTLMDSSRDWNELNGIG